MKLFRMLKNPSMCDRKREEPLPLDIQKKPAMTLPEKPKPATIPEQLKEEVKEKPKSVSPKDDSSLKSNLLAQPLPPLSNPHKSMQ